MAFKMKYKNLKEVVKQLKGAVKAHGKQAKVIEEHIDEMESPMKKRGLWDNIHAKRKRIKAGSKEKMRKPGSEGAPTSEALEESQA
jgi:predicted urease superfamily metal-dependent hydrolase